MVGTAAVTTLPIVRSLCDIWWPNTATRVGHHLDRTIQVRDMESLDGTVWFPQCQLPVFTNIWPTPFLFPVSLSLSVSLPPRSSGHINCKPARLKSLLTISTATLCHLLFCLLPGLWKSV